MNVNICIFEKLNLHQKVYKIFSSAYVMNESLNFPKTHNFYKTQILIVSITLILQI